MRTQLTVTGNLTNDPTARWTKDGVRIAEFGLAYNNRRLDRATGLWEDVEPTFYTVTCWRRLAENALSSLHKGDPVIVHGRFTTRDYERGDGQHRSELKIEAQALGPDLNRALSVVIRHSRANQPSPATTDPAITVPVAEPDDEDDVELPPETETELSGAAPAVSH